MCCNDINYIQNKCPVIIIYSGAAIKPEKTTPQRYLRLRLVMVRCGQCLKASGQYWAQVETVLCSPVQLWSRDERKREMREDKWLTTTHT